MSKAVTTFDINTQNHNPCVRSCGLDDKKVCISCGRSLAEILEWHHTDHLRQQQINIASKQRLSERAGQATLYRQRLPAD